MPPTYGTLIIQFAKVPLLGKVKTRLAKSLGDSDALTIHIRLARLTRQSIVSASHSLGADSELWLSEAFSAPQTQKFISDSFVKVYVQLGEDLGTRMGQALTHTLSRYQKVLLVGSDCPYFNDRYFAEAQNALTSHDLVLGPAVDGGYVLIGCRVFNAKVFDGVEWGGPNVMAQTLENAGRLGLSYKLLATLSDIDDIDDYDAWRRNL